MFAKLFEPVPGQQILVALLPGNEGCPEVRVHCEPEGLGVCFATFGYKDTPEGWDKAEAYFATYDQEKSLKIAAAIEIQRSD